MNLIFVRKKLINLACGRRGWNWAGISIQYTLFQNGYHFNIFLLVFKLALLSSFLRSKIKRIVYLEQGKKGLFECKQKNIKMVAILE